MARPAQLALGDRPGQLADRVLALRGECLDIRSVHRRPERRQLRVTEDLRAAPVAGGHGNVRRDLEIGDLLQGHAPPGLCDWTQVTDVARGTELELVRHG